jgi:hypothetical protein
MLKRNTLPFAGARAIAIVTIAAAALTSFEPSAAVAAPKAPGLSTHLDNTDFSAAKRRYARRGNGGAAAAAAFAGIVGTIGTIAAAQARRDYYESYGPRYYYGGPAYYSGPAYYGAPGYYGGYVPKSSGYYYPY